MATRHLEEDIERVKSSFTDSITVKLLVQGAPERELLVSEADPAYETVVAALDIAATMDDVQWIAAVLDRDGDGYLNRLELIPMVQMLTAVDSLTETNIVVAPPFATWEEAEAVIDQEILDECTELLGNVPTVEHPESGETVLRLVDVPSILHLILGDITDANSNVNEGVIAGKAMLAAAGLCPLHGNPFCQVSVIFGGEPLSAESGTFNDWGMADDATIHVFVHEEKDELEQAIGSFDGDNDGWLSREETKTLIRELEGEEYDELDGSVDYLIAQALGNWDWSVPAEDIVPDSVPVFHLKSEMQQMKFDGSASDKEKVKRFCDKYA